MSDLEPHGRPADVTRNVEMRPLRSREAQQILQERILREGGAVTRYHRITRDGQIVMEAEGFLRRDDIQQRFGNLPPWAPNLLQAGISVEDVMTVNEVNSLRQEQALAPLANYELTLLARLAQNRTGGLPKEAIDKFIQQLGNGSTYEHFQRAAYVRDPNLNFLQFYSEANSQRLGVATREQIMAGEEQVVINYGASPTGQPIPEYGNIQQVEQELGHSPALWEALYLANGLAGNHILAINEIREQNSNIPSSLYHQLLVDTRNLGAVQAILNFIRDTTNSSNPQDTLAELYQAAQNRRPPPQPDPQHGSLATPAAVAPAPSPYPAPEPPSAAGIGSDLADRFRRRATDHETNPDQLTELLRHRTPLTPDQTHRLFTEVDVNQPPQEVDRLFAGRPEVALATIEVSDETQVREMLSNTIYPIISQDIDPQFHSEVGRLLTDDHTPNRTFLLTFYRLEGGTYAFYMRVRSRDGATPSSYSEPRSTREQQPHPTREPQRPTVEAPYETRLKTLQASIANNLADFRSRRDSQWPGIRTAVSQDLRNIIRRISGGGPEPESATLNMLQRVTTFLPQLEQQSQVTQPFPIENDGLFSFVSNRINLRSDPALINEASRLTDILAAYFNSTDSLNDYSEDVAKNRRNAAILVDFFLEFYGHAEAEQRTPTRVQETLGPRQL